MPKVYRMIGNFTLTEDELRKGLEAAIAAMPKTELAAYVTRLSGICPASSRAHSTQPLFRPAVHGLKKPRYVLRGQGILLCTSCGAIGTLGPDGTLTILAADEVRRWQRWAERWEARLTRSQQRRA